MQDNESPDPASPTADDHAARLLHLVNPKALPSIPLDDLVLSTQRHLLLRVPAAYRPALKSALQSFIFDHRSFAIPSNEFVLCVKTASQAVKAQPAIVDSQNVVIPQAIRKKIRDLSRERKYIAYGEDLTKGLATQSKREWTKTHIRGGSAATRKPCEELSHSQVRKPSRQPALFLGDMSPAAPLRPLRKALDFTSATVTPKCSAPRHSSFSPKSRPNVPSLKEGMEKLLRERQAEQ